MKSAGVADKGRATAFMTQYKNMLALKILTSDYDDELLAPPPTLHVMWREHILDTASCAEHCRLLCGRLLNHSAGDPADDVQSHTKRCHRALAAYKKYFDDDAPSDLWDYGDALPSLSTAERARLLDQGVAELEAGDSGR